MSGLILGLTEGGSPIVRHTPEPLSLREAHFLWGRLSDAGVKAVLLTLAGPGQVKEQALGQLARGHNFPGWYGWNWDAVRDCLGELDAAGGPYCVLVPRPDDTFTSDDLGALQMLVDVLQDAGSVDGEGRVVPGCGRVGPCGLDPAAFTMAS